MEVVSTLPSMFRPLRQASLSGPGAKSCTLSGPPLSRYNLGVESHKTPLTAGRKALGCLHHWGPGPGDPGGEGTRALDSP